MICFCCVFDAVQYFFPPSFFLTLNKDMLDDVLNFGQGGGLFCASCIWVGLGMLMDFVFFFAFCMCEQHLDVSGHAQSVFFGLVI